MARALPVNPQVLARFLLGFEGTTLPDELREMLAKGLGGVAIFHRNFTSPQGLRVLTDEIRRASGERAIIGIDQEGGRRFALPDPFTRWPSAAELGRVDDTALVEDVARAMGRELRAAGCNLNFAPDLDLHMNPASPVTTDRSFGADPPRVARLGVAMISGLAAEGVLACGKHFPGHGDTQVDPHEDLPVYPGEPERLREVDLVPFRAAIGADVPMLMTAHILLPRMNADHPASLSRDILTGLLRREMGYEGVILADDLGMGAIRKKYGPGEAAVKAIQAGTDVVAMCHDWSTVRPAMEAVGRAFEKYEFDDIEWRAASLRLACLRDQVGETFKPASLEVVGCAEHRTLTQKASSKTERASG